MQIKKSVLKLPTYEVPQKARIKLNQNESPYDIPAEYKKEILNRLKKSSWNRYPSGNTEELKIALSDYTDYPSQGIIIGNGSNEMILATFLAICDKGDSITLISPGFAIYPYCAKILNLDITEIPLQNDFSFNTKALCKQAHKTKVMLFASPNNPTGTAIGISAIEEIIKINHCLVVVDEAYFEFYGLTAQKLLDKYRNLLILRTFSKAFGLAGVRLGYLIGNKEVVSQIEKAKLPFSVGIFQQVAAEFLLGHKRFVQSVVNKITEEREKIFKELNNMTGVKPTPSRANFILFGLKNHCALEVFQALYKKGILVRRFNHPDLNNMLRVTIGKPVENEVFLEVLRQICGGE